MKLGIGVMLTPGEENENFSRYEFFETVLCQKSSNGLIKVLAGNFSGQEFKEPVEKDIFDNKRYVKFFDYDSFSKGFNVYDIELLMETVDDVASCSTYVIDFNNSKASFKRLESLGYDDDYDEDSLEDGVHKEASKSLVKTDEDSNGMSVISGNNKLTCKDAIYKIKSAVVGQDDAIETIVSVLYENQSIKPDSGIEKNNVLIAGPTGVGKTEIIRQVSNILDVPMVIVDCNELTVAGYVGMDVEEIFSRLYFQAGKNIAKAERGIVVLDEIDKLAGNNDTSISTTGVLASLLKPIEGTVMDINIGAFGDSIRMNTKNISFIFAGAFEEMFKDTKKGIGFNSNISSEEKSEILPEEFVKFGMIPEFMGRTNNIVTMRSLGFADYKRILLESDISPIKKLRSLCENYNIDFTYDEDFVDYVVSSAVKLNVGARGLSMVINRIVKSCRVDMISNELERLDLFRDRAIVRKRKK